MSRLGSPFPLPGKGREGREEAEISVQAEMVPGEVELDAVIREQSLAPQVRKRVIELEDCLCALADRVERLPPGIREEIEADRVVQLARELLKNRLEIRAPNPHEQIEDD